jgi:hypothetical protein
MADYISREAAIEDFEQCNQKNSTWTPQRVKTLLMRIPAADVEPVRRGRWKRYSTTMMECSLCGKHTARHKFNYCPNCGAKMDLI